MSKPKVCVVTGYIPIIGHPRTAQEYGRLGEMWKELKHDVFPFYDRVENTWLNKIVAKVTARGGRPVSWSKGDNEAKNTLEYHCVQHQKFEILTLAKGWQPNYDTYVWIDYGIAHVPGVRPDVIDEMLNRVRANDLAIPGCWTRLDPRVEKTIESDYYPCWRFCGGVMVVPSYMVDYLFKSVRSVTRLRLHAQRRVSWEVNTLAQLERSMPRFPLRWYAADHDATLFTGYR